ncbi:MAG: undecaprenyl-diphosphate phosphatase [Lachnospiraceae bacterium]|nr:undecaprenyl-diphosphate phosphatase [Lachnospiraceae bacterium]
MSIIQAVLLGLLQGLTEFLPVSSSGHLAMFQNLFHIGEGTENMFMFDILLHVGTLVSIIIVFYKDIGNLIKEFFGIVGDTFMNIPRWISREPAKKVLRTSYRRFVIMIIVATIPTGIIGIILKDLVEDAAATLIIPGICFLMTAALLLISHFLPEGYKLPKDAGYIDSAIVGVAQGFATLPGLSRSGTTLTIGMLCGLDSRFALKFSFIMSIPAVLGAAVLEIKDAIGTKFELSYLVGMLVAAISGIIAIKFMVALVKRRKFVYFSIYCAICGIVCIVGHFLTK